MIIADTDVLIDFLHGQSPSADRVAQEIGAGLRTTVVTVFELLSGARTARQQSLAAELLAAVPALPLDQDSAVRAARLHRTLEETGDMIGMADSLIAGIVLRNGGRLLTRNRKHFERVPGLELVALTP